MVFDNLFFSFPPFSSMMMEHLHRHTGRKSLPIHPHADLNFARDINRTASLLHAAVISTTKNLPDGISVKYLSSHAKKNRRPHPAFYF
jgi:neutral trehalase